MNKIEIYNSVRIQAASDFWYTVEDTHVDAGCHGITIAYHEQYHLNAQHMCFSTEEAIAIANAILTLTKS